MTFKQLKKSLMDEELAIHKEMAENEPELEERFEMVKEGLEAEFNEIETLKDLVNYLDAQGYDVYEAYELIIKHTVEFPTDHKLVGRQVVVIDETQKTNNINIYTISKVDEEGTWFEGYTGPTVFYSDNEEKRFMQGFKAFIHQDEVSIQLVN